MPILDPLYEDHARLVAQRVTEIILQQPIPPLPEYVSPEEASRIIGVPLRTMQNWRFRDDGPPFTRYGQTIRYKVTDLHDWMQLNREGQ